ncbi:acylase [Myxococcaceae bacterium GXIMD 01537]
MSDLLVPSRPAVRALARRLRGLLLVPAALLLPSACGDAERLPPSVSYKATIRRTAHGIPHITADSLGSVGFGQGYAFAQDNACVLADQVLKVRGERSRFLGAGAGEANVASDFAYRSLDLLSRAQKTYDSQDADVKSLVDGYVAGYNKFLRDAGVANLKGPCAGQSWVRPITAVELLAHDLSISLTASSYQLVPYIAAAQPPGTTGTGAYTPPPLEELRSARNQDVGSNGWALGTVRTANGKGMVLANPHFPWEGELRLWESHLTVPGVLNVYGVGLMGVPGVLIGFNDAVAWTHTFSAGQRFTLYALPLVPGTPTSYVYDGQPRAMTARAITIPVLQPDGTVQTVTRTAYSSHYGPIISLPAAGLGWSTQMALSFRDANIDNTRFIAQFHAMNRAKSLADFKSAFSREQGIPWVNTMAANRDGETWYIDGSPTPNLSTGALQRWRTALNAGDPLTAGIYNTLGAVVLDGSNKDNEWEEEPGARSPGLVPFSKVPQLARPDFVFNANDSHWLTNPAARLEGYSPLHGLERVPQSPRTRMNATLLTEAKPGGASGADSLFSIQELKDAIYSNRSITEELLRAQVVARCTGQTTVTVGTQTVDISQACTLLSNWNGNFNADSVGAVIWREFAGTAPEAQLRDKGPFFDVAFDPTKAVATPHTLTPAPASGQDPILTKLGEAVVALGKAGVALNAQLGQVQYSPRGGQKTALHGGQGRDGVANVLSFGTLKSTLEPGGAQRGTLVNSRTGLLGGGYVVNNGTSFLMAMSFDDTGVDASAVLTYGQSEAPAMPHYADQLPLYAGKQWRKLLFSEQDIAADPALQTTVISGY